MGVDRVDKARPEKMDEKMGYTTSRRMGSSPMMLLHVLAGSSWPGLRGRSRARAPPNWCTRTAGPPKLKTKCSPPSKPRSG
jgi:hypothetical protein